jgi:hypothetical protein
MDGPNAGGAEVVQQQRVTLEAFLKLQAAKYSCVVELNRVV